MVQFYRNISCCFEDFIFDVFVCDRLASVETFATDAEEDFGYGKNLKQKVSWRLPTGLSTIFSTIGLCLNCKHAVRIYLLLDSIFESP